MSEEPREDEPTESASEEPAAAAEPGAPEAEIAAEPSYQATISDEEIARLVPAMLEPEALLGEPEPELAPAPALGSTPVRRSPARRPPKSLFGLLRPNGAVILLGLVCALAFVESLAALLAYRERIDDDDWRAVAQLLDAHEGEPVIVASEWLGPSARMHLERARGWDSLGYPDLRGYRRFWLLAHTRERPWQGALRAELEQLRRPELVAVHQIGELALHEYEQEVGELRFSLLDAITSVATGRGRCSGGGGRWSCKDGRVEIKLLEVDYRVRRCLAVELDDGVLATVELGEQELGDRVHGHVGFGDFNARLRADPTARIELLIDDEVRGRWVFTDDQGWAGFALATPPGRHRVALRVGTTVGGTWQRDGHRSSPTDSLCVELRGFDESALEDRR